MNHQPFGPARLAGADGHRLAGAPSAATEDLRTLAGRIRCFLARVICNGSGRARPKHVSNQVQP